jgi:hypothetical protein
MDNVFGERVWSFHRGNVFPGGAAWNMMHTDMAQTLPLAKPRGLAVFAVAGRLMASMFPDII